MISGLSSDIPSMLAAIGSYIWVTNVTIGYDFIHTLFTNPHALFGTVFVHEIILSIDNIAGVFHLLKEGIHL